jgi:acyl carrier protein
MEQTLREIVAKVAEASPEFDANASLRDALHVDSVRALEIVFEIEKTFGITVPEERYGEAQTLNGILKLVSSIVA